MGEHLEDAHARMAHIEPLLYDSAMCEEGREILEMGNINMRKAR